MKLQGADIRSLQPAPACKVVRDPGGNRGVSRPYGGRTFLKPEIMFSGLVEQGVEIDQGVDEGFGGGRKPGTQQAMVKGVFHLASRGQVKSDLFLIASINNAVSEKQMVEIPLLDISVDVFVIIVDDHRGGIADAGTVIIGNGQMPEIVMPAQGEYQGVVTTVGNGHVLAHHMAALGQQACQAHVFDDSIADLQGRMDLAAEGVDMEAHRAILYQCVIDCVVFAVGSKPYTPPLPGLVAVKGFQPVALDAHRVFAAAGNFQGGALKEYQTGVVVHVNTGAFFHPQGHIGGYHRQPVNHIREMRCPAGVLVDHVIGYARLGIGVIRVDKMSILSPGYQLNILNVVVGVEHHAVDNGQRKILVNRVDGDFYKYEEAVVCLDGHIMKHGSGAPVDIDAKKRLTSSGQGHRREIDAAVVGVVHPERSCGRTQAGEHGVEKQGIVRKGKAERGVGIKTIVPARKKRHCNKDGGKKKDQ